MAHDELKQLKIKTGVLKRIVKDLNYTDKEISAQAAKVEKMKAEQADAYDVKKQEEVLAEYASSRPQDEERLKGAITDLSKLVEQCRESPEFKDLEATNEFTDAVAMLEESKNQSQLPEWVARNLNAVAEKITGAWAWLIIMMMCAGLQTPARSGRSLGYSESDDAGPVRLAGVGRGSMSRVRNEPDAKLGFAPRHGAVPVAAGAGPPPRLIGATAY
eukprot:CAMPEP_0205998470 /NCGR_PEP_ID=MMETSP1464-20131121/269_1 /ASSEMBLY_ACC=CAM_ASM_001124 /TAXON_ID=119497 /ORGANISM="Exanthemachrysis gayraliae, Strain RCC1523" /LENGTH=216 /DNA_ID=CAMNT_0053371619 /DNA_START=25 /DNA_END=677 /DNA_ORIENTATION=+